MAQSLILLTIGLPWLGAVAAGSRETSTRAPSTSWRWLQRGRRPRGPGADSLARRAAIVLRLPIGGLFGDMTFVPDGLGVFLAAVATVIGSLAVIFSVDYMHGEAQLGRYYSLVLFFIGAMAGLVLTQQPAVPVRLLGDHGALLLRADLLLQRRSEGGRGGIKALIITQIGGIGLLAGALVVYAYLGTYEIDAFLQNAAHPAGRRRWP